METYQPIYDAVRSRVHNGDIGSAVQEVLNNCNISHYADMASRSIQEVASMYDRPSVMYRPKVFIDGNRWCALYGDDLQAGVAGFGDSPSEAMDDFDVAWHQKLRSQEGGK